MRKKITVIVTVWACIITLLSGCGTMISLKDQDGESSIEQEDESSENDNTNMDSEEDEESSNNDEEEYETYGYLKPYVVDKSEYISESDKKLLSKRACIISMKYDFDIVMAVIEDYDTENIQIYVDDFYDYNGYSKDGLILVISMKTGEYCLSTSGKAIDGISDTDIDYMFEVIEPYLQSGDLYEAFDNYITQVEEIMEYND